MKNLNAISPKKIYLELMLAVATVEI